jgi:hypothetical protein
LRALAPVRSEDDKSREEDLMSKLNALIARLRAALKR